jgi:two-component sensor histidine kinase
MLARPAVKPLSTFKKLSGALGAVAFLAAAWLVQAPMFADDPEAKATGFLAGLVLAGGIGSWINVEKTLAFPWLRRLNNAAQAGTMISIGMMALEAIEGVIAGFRSIGAGAAAPVAPITLRQVDGLMSPRVAAWAIFSVALWLLLLRFYRHRAEASAQSRLRREAEDSALRARLAPHFIFNALNTLKAQIELAPTEAAATADRLASLFRQVLSLTDRPTVPLREELAFVEAYLGIERARLGKRLRVRLDIAEELEAATVPTLSLQVLVENAVKHGVAPRQEGGEVLIWARWSGPGSGRRLQVGVESPAAPGARPATASNGTGTGLQALRGRLERPDDLVVDSQADRFRVQFSCRGLAA